ncbi:hypothetical protein HZB00_02900 [Candidatus Woesearchaeota archaeon]|nr:hypothetical protein [Candidatus Woesearchaeota archaeon]
MLSSILEAYKRITASKEFIKEGFLCGVFIMAPAKDIENTVWQLDFYNKEKDVITSYKDTNPVAIEHRDDQVFKEEKTSVNELKLEEVKVSPEEALKAAKKILKDKHETADQVIIILQQQEIPMWNISFLTSTFNLLNIKINARKLNVVEEKIASLLSFKTDNKDDGKA